MCNSNRHTHHRALNVRSHGTRTQQSLYKTISASRTSRWYSLIRVSLDLIAIRGFEFPHHPCKALDVVGSLKIRAMLAHSASSIQTSMSLSLVCPAIEALVATKEALDSNGRGWTTGSARDDCNLLFRVVIGMMWCEVPTAGEVHTISHSLHSQCCMQY
jgi:hypothetical protein